jgi:hypothetical protein
VDAVQRSQRATWERALPLARLAELGIARVSFAGFLKNQLYNAAHEAKLTEIAAEVSAIA